MIIDRKRSGAATLSRVQGPDTRLENGPVRVALVDRVPVIRTGVRLMLEARPTIAVTLEASSIPRELFLDGAPIDVVVVRVTNAKDLDTFGIRARPNRAPRLLVLAADAGDTTVRRAVAAGASGVASTDVTPAALADAVETIGRGEAWLGRQSLGRLISSLAGRRRAGRRAPGRRGPPVQISRPTGTF